MLVYSEELLSVIVFLCVGYSSQYCGQFDNSREIEIESAIDELFENLQYFMKHEKSNIEDVTLGVIMVKTNVEWIFKNNPKLEESLIRRLDFLIQLCDKIIYNYQIKLGNDENALTQIAILQPEIWENSAGDLKNHMMESFMQDFTIPGRNSCSSFLDYIFGSPYPFDSCVELLVKNGCEVPKTCLTTDSDVILSHGYQTTHRLLFLQVAERFQCGKYHPLLYENSQRMKVELCSKILREAESLEKENYPIPARDLFMEQTALCGLEGFLEFAKDNWRKELKKWRTSEGCLGFNDEEKFKDLECLNERNNLNGMKRKKRNDSIMENGCHSHLNSVGIASLAFHLRYLLSSENLCE